MNISIELLAIIIPLLFLLIGLIWFYLSLKINKWRYKKENDQGRKFKRPERNGSITKSELVVEGTTQLTGHSLLQATDDSVESNASSDGGKTSNSSGENGKPRKNPFRRN